MLDHASTEVRQLLARTVQRLRDRGATALTRALRLTGAAVVAYLVARWLLPSGRSVLAPLTALLVVQVTLFSTLTTGIRRIASVVVGVVVAALFADLVELTWWSLAALVAAGIVVGQLLRLREHLLEVPISAMLVLSIGGAENKTEARIFETLLGAAVGVLYMLLLPGPVQSRTAGEAVEHQADEMADLLRRMAVQIGDGVNTERATEWLEGARSLSRRVGRVDRVLEEADESRRLNVRALGTMDPAPLLTSGLDALEHSSVSLRSLCRAMVDRSRSAEGEPYPEPTREVLAVLLQDLADAVSAFGRLVREEAEGEVGAQAQRLAQALEAVGEARVRLTELLLIDRRDDAVDGVRWELDGVLLANVARILREIDIEERVRQQDRQREQQQSRPPAVQAVDRLRATSREAVRPVRRRRRRGSNQRR
ncbi:MAG: FUSC family protein [Nocardioidaceae bacterium]|nr:FUSC family protein [Nocardioidaceae bacterium]